MIGRIKGVLLEKQPPELLVDVGGIAYEVQAPMPTIYQLPAIGETVTLYTHFVVREDAQLLYGFGDRAERSLFRSLIRVNGVGPKMALTLLSGIEASEFARCIHEDDVKSLVRLPGVGRKTAERLLIEMRDKVTEWQGEVAPAAGAESVATVEAAPSDLVADAEGALVALGYRPQEAARAVSAVNDDSHSSSETLIRAALRNMVR